MHFKRIYGFHLTVLASAASLALAAQNVHAATLTSVPMQGGMVMPMVAYHADQGTISVTMPPAVPQLTPLLVSHPGDYFDPADPWFQLLDPAGQGQSFSRRYGFVMDANTDLLPPGTQFWIRKISSSPELSAFRYQAKILEPIFGTAGVTNAMAWNGMMFHPLFAAPPGTNDSTAVFELFLLDTTTGEPVPGANSGPLTFTWSNVPDGRPTLRLDASRMVCWPAAATQWVLEATDTLPDGAWTLVTNAPVPMGSELAVPLPPDEPRKFFRMKLAP